MPTVPVGVGPSMCINALPPIARTGTVPIWIAAAGRGAGACSDPAAGSGWQWQWQRHGHVGAAGEPARGAPRAGSRGTGGIHVSMLWPLSESLFRGQADMIHRMQVQPRHRRSCNRADLFNAGARPRTQTTTLPSATRGNRARCMVSSSMLF